MHRERRPRPPRSSILAGIRLIALAAVFNAAPARADDCNAALARFDYRGAEAAAQARLAAAPGEAAAWLCLARSRYEQGDFPSALRALRQTEPLVAATPLRVQTWNWFAVTLRRLGETARAWEYQLAALRLAEGIADPAGLGTALHNMAGLLHDAGRLHEALAHYRASLGINPDAAERSASLNNMALIEASLGHDDRASALFRQAIALNRGGGQFHHLGKHLVNLGNHLRRLGRFAEAEALIAEGSGLVAQAGDRYWIGVARHLEAWLARDRGDAAQARRLLEAAAAAYRDAGALPEAARVSREAVSLAGESSGR